MSIVEGEISPAARRSDAAAGRQLARLELFTREREAPRVELTCAAALPLEPIRWLWKGYLARGKYQALAGAPGTGKTTIAMHIAARVSAGATLPDGSKPERGSVVIWSGEDDPADTLKPRLIAAGADMTRVFFVGDVSDKGGWRAFDPSRDVAALAAAVDEIPGLAMIVVDPLVSAVSGDSHKGAEVRRGLAPLIDLAAKKGAALLGITHYSKGTQGRDPLERVTGSIAYGAAARVVLGTARQQVGEGQPQLMILARVKSNIGPDGGGFTYAFEQTALDGYEGIVANGITWGAAVEGSARELLSEPESKTEGGGSGAAQFLRDLLAGGPRPAKEIFREAADAGYSDDQLKRAKGRVGVDTTKAGMNGGWIWRLAGQAAQPDTAACVSPSPSSIDP
jgi:hypothetical protein